MWRNTLNQTAGYKAWQIIYPIGIYYVVSSIAYFFLSLIIGEDPETYMFRQMICAACTLPVICSFYRRDKMYENNVYGRQRAIFSRKNIIFAAISVVGVGALGIAVNNIIVMTSFVNVSDTFTATNASFFAGGVLFEALGSCLIIPIAEELLFRGVVYKRLRLYTYSTSYGAWPAIIVSALIFGAVHFNLVQFVYAFILAIFLAALLEKSRNLLMSVLGHIAANSIAVIRAETGWLEFSYSVTASGVAFTIFCLLLAASMMIFTVRTDPEI
jgi:hypothetical protein